MLIHHSGIAAVLIPPDSGQYSRYFEDFGGPVPLIVQASASLHPDATKTPLHASRIGKEKTIRKTESIYKKSKVSGQIPTSYLVTNTGGFSILAASASFESLTLSGSLMKRNELFCTKMPFTGRFTLDSEYECWISKNTNICSLTPMCPITSLLGRAVMSARNSSLGRLIATC